MPGKDADSDSTTDALRSDIKTANGGMLTVESMASAWKSGESSAGGLASGPIWPITAGFPGEAAWRIASQEVMGACGLSRFPVF